MSGKILKAINAVMSEVGVIPKTGENDFHNYKYASEADVLKRLRPAMVKAGLILLPSVTKIDPIDEWGNTTIEVSYTLAHVDGEVWPTPLVFGGCGGDRNKNGVGDKGLYKAITGANKYMLFKLFQLETGDDPENDAAQQKEVEETNKKARAAYMQAALDISIPKGHDTVGDLTKWWKDEKANREKLGITDGTEEYDKLVKALSVRKGQIMAKETGKDRGMKQENENG